MRNALLVGLSAALLIGCESGREQQSDPDVATPTSETAEASIDRLDELLSRLEAMGFSGAVIVEHQGRVALRRGYGLADRETRRPYTSATVQTHGSITKQMTAAAILLLESRGELSVEDPIGKYFDGVPANKQGITLHQLLTHSAGFPGGIGPDNEPIGADEFVERAMAAPLEFEPGGEYSYSNVGYSLLGIILEKVTGRGYETFLREELLLPAGLAETGYLLPNWDQERLAVGYLDGERWGRVHRREWREDGPGWHLRANGGLHTAVDDMRQWLAVIQGRGPLAPAVAEKWTTGYVDEGGDSMYAYGWAVHDSELGRMVAHNGGNGIFSADFIWIPGKDFFLYIQGNTSVIRAASLREGLLRAVFDPGFELPPRVRPRSDADPAQASSRTGSYESDGGHIRLIADYTRLIALLSGQDTFDAVLDHGDEERRQINELNRRAARIVERLQQGREDAMEGLVREDEDAAARARSMLDAIERGGELRSTELVGSVVNEPGTRFADYGAWTTFVRAEFEDGPQMWGILWREDGTYRGTAIGPPSDVPGFILVPTAPNTYTGIERGPPWRRIEVRFDGECLALGGLRACRW